MENQYLHPENKTVIAYRVIEVEQIKTRYRFNASYSSVYAVIELKDIKHENIEEIDTTLICDDYFEYIDDEDEM